MTIDRFRLKNDDVIADKYRVIRFLGGGWEGEVYLVEELLTGIERTAKFFYPARNLRNSALKHYARKLHKLRQCPIVIQYHTQETVILKGYKISILFSEYVEGKLLSQFIRSQPGKRLSPFQGIHLLHSLATGLETIHGTRDYHGDLHMENILVQRFGLGFDLKLLDMFNWGPANGENYRGDICDVIRIFYDILGGAKHYSKHPPEVKAIICGLKRNLILKKFRNASQLRLHIENMEWQS